MATQSTPRVHPMLDSFERLDMIYKTVNGVEFDAAVLVPKSLVSSEKKAVSPLLVHFHGGSLIMGINLDTEILSVWPLELAAKHNAIFVSPAYRLLPEAKGSDILEDVEDFWSWVRTSLKSEVAARYPHISVDIDRTAVMGESAGGYLALESAFLHPEANIKLVMPAYPAMYPDIAPYAKRFLGSEAPPNMDAVADKYLENMAPGAIRIHEPYWKFLPTAVAILRTKAAQLMSGDERLTLEYGLRHAQSLPPVWVMQGTDDEIIPAAATNEMVERIRKAHPQTPLLYSVQPGPHGFDNDHSLSEPWVAEGVEFASKYWP